MEEVVDGSGVWSASCDVCGVPSTARSLTMAFGDGGNGRELSVLCPLCESLIDSGVIRPELTEDGSIVYRHWRMAWTPGSLVKNP